MCVVHGTMEQWVCFVGYIEVSTVFSICIVHLLLCANLFAPSLPGFHITYALCVGKRLSLHRDPIGVCREISNDSIFFRARIGVEEVLWGLHECSHANVLGA